MLCYLHDIFSNCSPTYSNSPCFILSKLKNFTYSNWRQFPFPFQNYIVLINSRFHCSFIDSFTYSVYRINHEGRHKQLSSTLTLILPRSRTGTIWFYTSTSNKRAARPKLYTKSLTRDLKLMSKAGNIVGGALHHKL